jgi:hypothetical protein
MRRVWGVYVMRQLTSPALRLGALVVTVVGIVSSVSITHVVSNALATSGLSGFARFSLYAVTNTTVFVQVLIALAFGIGMWFIIDAVRSVAFTRQMQTSV